jgi:hypothetical protein
MTATLMSLAEQACRPAGRILTLVTLLMVLGGIPRSVPPVLAHTPARAIRQTTCAAGVPAPAVCDRVLGVALTLPKGVVRRPAREVPPRLPGLLDAHPRQPGATLASRHRTGGACLCLHR